MTLAKSFLPFIQYSECFLRAYFGVVSKAILFGPDVRPQRRAPVSGRSAARPITEALAYDNPWTLTVNRPTHRRADSR